MMSYVEKTKVLVGFEKPDVQRIDRLAEETGQPRATLVRRIVVEAIYSAEAERVLAGEGGAKWR